MSTNMSLSKGLYCDMSVTASTMSSRRKLIDYTKNRARFVGERRRKRSSMCSDFQTTIDRVVSRAAEEDEETTSVSTAGSADLIVFFMRRRIRRVDDDDLESQVDDSEDGCESHALEAEEDLFSLVSESETPSEGAHFGYLPGAIRKITNPFSSPRQARSSVKKSVEDNDESARSVGSQSENDHSCVSFCSDSECSTQVTSTASQGNSSMKSLSCRSVRSHESLELGLLSHGFVNRRKVGKDCSQSSVTSSFPNQEESKSVRSVCSRSATGRSLDSMASSLLRTPTSHNRGKGFINPSLSGGYHIRSNHVHTPSSVKKSKYLQPFSPFEGDHDISQRSARSAGGTTSRRPRDRTISLKDFFRKEAVKRVNPDTTKQTMSNFTPKPVSLNKAKSSETTPRRKRGDSDASAPETPVTASMTSQTMSTPSGRSGLLRSFSFSDKGNSLMAELNQNLKRGLLRDFEDDDDFADDASVANSEALASLMDGLRHTSKSSRALGISVANSFDDSSSRLDDSSFARSVNDQPFLSKSYSDSSESESDGGSMEIMVKAATDSSQRLLESQTASLRLTPKYDETKPTSADDTDHGGVLAAMVLERHLVTGNAYGERPINRQDGRTQSENLVTTSGISLVKSTVQVPPAGFLIQPKALPLRRLHKGTLPFAPLDYRMLTA